jgi:biotin carboxylase
VTKRILVVFPTAWDRKHLPLDGASRTWSERYEVIPAGPRDEECAWDCDALGLIEREVEEHRGRIDGVTTSSDYPGACVAAAIARRLELPGPSPEAVLRSSHKYYARLAQREWVPDATPAFWLVDPDDPAPGSGIEFPCFLKPVKGAFSIMSGVVGDGAELRAFLDRSAVREFCQYWVHIFNQLLRSFTDLELGAAHFLAEEVLRGDQVTLEGFSCRGSVEVLGIVDSVKDPRTGSFVRFDYPSALDPRVQERMVEIARRLVPRLGLDDTLFNIEMIHDAERDRIGIVEVNPRMCGQFADLYLKVDGTSGYEVALRLASGERPAIRRRRGEFGAASSVPLRIFEPARVLRSPGESLVREVERAFPGALVWCECEAGQELVDFETREDGRSIRYAVINVGGEDREDVLRRARAVEDALAFEFTPLG